ncbi:hypothetical protein COCNU_02G016530 [Cocos nucifera]|uniref:Uncharacterized protein n=1 Tax=Cocos nucifera TaxID=13894 RepID=A0A8K0MXA8_COCNU|nr:hypothetical protein COCNU_02G016530 [Cocos nucifera]
MISSPSLYSSLPPSLRQKSEMKARDFHEMKMDGIVICSTLVALVYISEYSYGRSITHTFWAWPHPVWRMPPLWHGLPYLKGLLACSDIRFLRKIKLVSRVMENLPAWFGEQRKA